MCFPPVFPVCSCAQRRSHRSGEEWITWIDARGRGRPRPRLVSQLTFGLDSGSLIVSAAARREKKKRKEAASWSSLIHAIKYAAEASSYQLFAAVSEP